METAAAGGMGPLQMGTVVVGTALDLTGLRLQSKTALRAAAAEVGADAGAAMGKGMGAAAAVSSAPALADAVDGAGSRVRTAARKAGEGAGKEFAKGVAAGADRGQRDLVAKMTDGLDERFNNKLAALRIDVFAGAKTAEAAQREAETAARVYNRELNRAVRAFRREHGPNAPGLALLGAKFKSSSGIGSLALPGVQQQPGGEAQVQRAALLGDKVAERYTRAMERRLKNRQAEIKELQAANLMSPREAEMAGLEAAQNYDRGMMAGMRKLRTARTTGMGRTAASTDATTRMAETLILPKPNAQRGDRDPEAVAQRYVSGLRKKLDAEGAKIKADLLENLISPREAERKGREAGERYQRALLRSMRRMQAEGRMTSGTANVFGGAMINAREFGKEMNSLNDAPGILARIGQSAKMWIAGVMVAALFGAATAIRALIGTLEDARQKLLAALRLDAAAKLYSVPLKDLRKLAADAGKEFGLTAGQAADVATQVGKMAARAGQSARAQELLSRAMDLGAASGLKLQEITEALGQTFRGEDEGLNRMGLADPSSHYKKLAKEIGTTEDKLTDAQKQMAVMNAIIEAGTKVQGSYGRQLRGDLGTLNKFETFIKAAREEIGLRFLPIAAQLVQQLRGPMAGAVRFISGILDRLTNSLDRVIGRMHRMGVEAARIAPFEAERNIRESREEMERMVPDMARLARRIGIDPGTRTSYFREGSLIAPKTMGGHFDQTEINAARADAERRAQYWERVARESRIAGSRAPSLSEAQRMAPVVPGRERQTANLVNRAAQGDAQAIQRLLSDAQDYNAAAQELSMAVDAYIATQGRIVDIEASMPDLIARAELQERLDAINRSTAQLYRTAQQAATAAGVTGEAWARMTEEERARHLSAGQRTQLTALEKEAESLDVQINGPTPTPPGTEDPKELSKDAKSARDALREMVTELDSVAQFRNAVGEPFRNLEEVPGRLRSAIAEIIGYEREIQQVEDQIRESGQAAPAAVQRHLAGLREIVAGRKSAAQQLRQELAANGELISDEARQLRDTLSDASAGFRGLQALGVGVSAPEEITRTIGEVVRLDEQIKAAQRDMAALNREGHEPPPGARAWVAELQRQRAEAVAVLAAFKGLRDVLHDLEGLSPDTFQGMDKGEIANVASMLRKQAAATAAVREAEDRLMVARERFGRTSREARQAERELVDAQQDSRRAIFALMEAIKRSTLSAEEQRRVLRLLRAEYDRLAGSAEKVDSKTEKFAEFMDVAARTAASLTDVGLELELINEQQAKVIMGFVEMADSASKFAAAASTGNIAGMVTSAVGFIQGAVKFTQGLTGESEAQKAVRTALLEVRDALQSLEETILNDRSTREIQADRAAVAKAAGALDADSDVHSTYGPTRRGSLADLAVQMGLAEHGDSKGAKIEALKRWAAEIDEKYGTNLAWFVENSRPEELLTALSGLEAQLGKELTELGTFGTDVAGVLAGVNYELEVLGNTDAAEGVRRKTQALIASSNSLGEFIDEFAELATLDLNTAAGQARRDEIVQSMMVRSRATDVDFGDMSPDEFRELLLEWAKAEPGEGNGETDSAAVNRSVTEVTGSRLVGWLATIAHYARSIYEYLTGDTLSAPKFSPGGAGPTDANGSVPAGPAYGLSGGAALVAAVGQLAAERVAGPAKEVVNRIAGAMPRAEGRGASGPPLIYASVTVPLSVTGEIVSDDPAAFGDEMGRGIRRGLGDLADEALGARMRQQLRARGAAHEIRRNGR